MYVLISKETQYKRVVTICLFHMSPKLFAEEQSGVLLVRDNAIKQLVFGINFNEN